MILEIKDFSCHYQSREKPTLSHVDLSLREGEMVLLAGRSGSGKSTLIKAITHLLDEEGEQSGQIFLDGKDNRQMTAEDIGLLAGTVYQTPDDQLFAMTVGDETAFALENRGESPEVIRREVSRALEKTGLSGMEGRSIHALSGGQRQRLALASVLVTRPKLLILDEPVSQMNPQGVTDFLELLKSLNEKDHMTILVVEHRVNEMARWFSRLAVMYEGTFIYDGPMEEAWTAIGDSERYGLREPQTVKLGRRLQLSELSSSTKKTAEEIQARYPHIMRNLPKTRESQKEGAPFLSCRGVTYRYPGDKKDTLHELDFVLQKGSINALMGFNGAGKSTLMNILGGLEAETAGEVLLEGEPLKKQQHRVGYLRQEADLMLLTDTVREEILWNNRELTEEETDALLRQLHVRHYKNDFPLALSKGQRLRVVFGALLARKKTDLLLLDEPTTGQDQTSLNEIKRLLFYAASQGKTIFFCTHDTEMVSAMADQVLVLAEGRLIGKGSPREVLASRELLLTGGLSLPPMLDVSERLQIEPCVTIEEVEDHVASAALGRDQR